MTTSTFNNDEMTKKDKNDAEKGLPRKFSTYGTTPSFLCHYLFFMLIHHPV